MRITRNKCCGVWAEDEHGRYLTVFNNEGNNRVLREGDCIDHKADASAAIRAKPDVEPEILYSSPNNVRLEKGGQGEYSLFVPATDLVILRY